jgi:hypothetical protein
LGVRPGILQEFKPSYKELWRSGREYSRNSGQLQGTLEIRPGILQKFRAGYQEHRRCLEYSRNISSTLRNSEGQARNTPGIQTQLPLTRKVRSVILQEFKPSY